jgi:heme/copper-type cytochrome/quinol oxidase subunit 1
MLTAKLLGGSAGDFVALAVAMGARSRRALDLYFHDTYFVIAPSHFFLFCAFLCAVFGLVYFLASRWTMRPPNRTVGMASAALLLMSALTFGETFVLGRNLPPSHSEAYFIFAALFGFVLAAVLLAANLAFALAWTLLDRVRRPPLWR